MSAKRMSVKGVREYLSVNERSVNAVYAGVLNARQQLR